MVRAITDHDAIMAWALKHHVVPATVGREARTPGHVGFMRFVPEPLDDVPPSSGFRILEWPEFFQKFDRGQLALLVDDTPPDDATSGIDYTFARRMAVKRAIARWPREHMTV